MDIGLAGAGDPAIWDYALQRGVVIVTKDEDFGSSVFPVMPTISWGVMRTRISDSRRGQGKAVERDVRG
jgi:predicted nuclease of predicted toxin-antitoxin system